VEEEEEEGRACATSGVHDGGQGAGKSVWNLLDLRCLKAS
jgi:hypothetical protein